MTWVLVCRGLATFGTPPHPELDGQFLASFDVDAHDGRGSATWSPDIAEAMHFPRLSAAILAWQTQSRVRPKRPDGRDNRPLTAFHVEPREV